MNTTIQNPVAAVASAMNPAVAAMTPVTSKDIAAKLGMTPHAVRICLSRARKNVSTPTVVRVMKAAEEMGYKGKGDQDVCIYCGNAYTKVKNGQLVCPKCKKLYDRELDRQTRGCSVVGGWFGGNFATKEEETARMKELREMGYSNKEISEKVGRSYSSVWHRIGKQDPELTKQNVAMAHHIRAQKNAARKQYAINKPIREYNRRVEQHNQMKAELNKLQTELLTEKPAIVQAAQTKIDFPMIDLHTVQPTALQ